MAKPKRPRPDFVMVKLSAAGEKFAAGGPVTIVARSTFVFVAGEEQEVTRAVEWDLILAAQLVDGEPMFEIVETAPLEYTSTGI